MIKITDGKQVIVVTNGAFEDIYKRQGFRAIDDVARDQRIAETASKALADHGVGEAQPEPEPEPTGFDKPLVKWTKDECAEFVREHDIDLEGATKPSAVKAKIQAYLDAQE